jgi:hypothetical protein
VPVLLWCLRLDLGVSERLGCDSEGSCVLLPAYEALVCWKGRRGRRKKRGRRAQGCWEGGRILNM